MPVTTTAELVADAVRARQAVAAFNVITLEHAEGICRGAEIAGQAVILQLSHNAIRFHDSFIPIASACAAVARTASVDVALHLDHLESLDVLDEAARLGFSSVMVDTWASAGDDSVTTARRAVDEAHRLGLWVEAELGHVGGKAGDPHAVGVRTDPELAEAFVEDTGVDGLAVAVGSAHAMRDRSAALDIPLVATLRDILGIPLVLHGSSGVGDEELRRAVAAGIAKVNIGTALNIAYTTAIRRHLEADPAVVDPRHYLQAARHEIAAVVADRILAIAPARAAGTGGPSTAHSELHTSGSALLGSPEQPNTEVRP